MKRKITTLVFLIMVLLGTNLISQNNVPIAVNDTVMPILGSDITIFDTILYINVLENDFDPNGEPIKIYDVRNRQGQKFVLEDYTDSAFILNLDKAQLWEHVFDYRVCKVNDTNSISNWAYLNVNPALEADFPIARNDTVFGMPGFPVMINALQNDLHPLGDSMFLYSGGFIPDSILTYNCPQFSNEDYLVRTYFLSDTSEWFLRYDMGLIYIKILNNEWYDSLNINNINARYNCNGRHHWNLSEGIPHFKAPNGSEVSSIFTQTLWIGGYDDEYQLHIAADRFYGEDFWAGPVSNVYDSLYDMRWMHVWNLTKEEIEYHKANWWKSEYNPLPDILSWPGNGDIESGQAENIAPYEDNNGNGIYEPMQGDAPQIRGDQTLFFVFNDDRKPHTETEGIPLGVEIRATAYAFDQPEDSALWNSIFIHYDIVNRSDTTYQDMYMGIFTDVQLGQSSDNRIECDVQNGMYFSYNGKEVDGWPPYYPDEYGEHPPAQGIQILGGPTMQEDGIDNPKYDALGQQIVDESINGLNFGDGIVDNERMGMTNFIGIYEYEGYTPEEYYQILNSYTGNFNLTKLLFGGWGIEGIGNTVGPECNFMFPGDTDPFNWGTNGMVPNGGYNQNGYYWTEEQEDAYPGERSGLGSMGPFSMLPGQTQSLDLALPWARDFEGSAWSSAELLKERAAYIKDKFQNDPDFFSRIIPQSSANSEILIYPNPVSNNLHVKLPVSPPCKSFNIYNVFGTLVMTKPLAPTQENIDLECSNLPPGIYVLQINASDQVFRSKFIKK